MKKSIKKVIAISCLVALHLSANFAYAGEKEGNSSGGGSGDAAFEMQRVFAANPELKPEEVLEKLFDESEGRVPPLNLVQTGPGLTKYRIYKIGNVNRGLAFNVRTGDFSENSCKLCTAHLLQELTNLGPLFGGIQASSQLIPTVSPANPVYDDSAFSSIIADLKDATKNATLSYSASSMKFHYPTGSFTELRAYRPNIIIRVTKSGELKNCSGEPSNVSNELCSIGYDWLDENK